MAIQQRRPEGGRRPDGGRRPFQKKKACRFCKDKAFNLNYKDAKAIRPYLTERGRIVPRRISGTCAKHQRMVCREIKRARNLALIPFTAICI